jgi:ankyrin repeat protein
VPEPHIFTAIATDDADSIQRILAQDASQARARNQQGVSALMAAWYTFNPRLRDLVRAHVRDLDIFEAAAVGDLFALTAHLDADQSLIGAYSPDGFTPLHFAGFFNHPDVARALIDRGAPLDAVTHNDLANMPLHAAAAGRANDVCRLLLDAGADPKATQHGGFTPLHEAAHHGNDELVEMLLAHGADRLAKNNDGQSPSEIAAAAGHTALADRLQID